MVEITYKEFGSNEDTPGKIGHLKYRLGRKLSKDEVVPVPTRKLPRALKSAILDIMKMSEDATKKAIIVEACSRGFEVLNTEPVLIEYTKQLKLLQESKIGDTDEFSRFQNSATKFNLKYWENPGTRNIHIEKEDLNNLDELELKLGLGRSDITVLAMEIGLKTILDDLGFPRKRVHEMLNEDIAEFLKIMERMIVILWTTFREFEIDTTTRTIKFKDEDGGTPAQLEGGIPKN